MSILASPFMYCTSSNRDDEEFDALMNALSGDFSCDDNTLMILDKQKIRTCFSVQTGPTEQVMESINICPHGRVSGTCWFCTEMMDVAFRDMHENLRFSGNEIAWAREQELTDLLGRRKLYLVLDLDHTLLHSVHWSKLTVEEKLLYGNMDSLPDSLRCGLHKLDTINMLTKLRPFVHWFLREASDLFEMYICTRGDRIYALEMAKLLDPDNVYFNNYSKVMGREDCPEGNRKSLDVFRGQENAVVILDDTEEVWGNDKSNLLVAVRCHYLAASLRRDRNDENLKSHSLLNTDESETSGPLATSLNVLRYIHSEFFRLAERNNDLVHQDVRQVLSSMHC